MCNNSIIFIKFVHIQFSQPNDHEAAESATLYTQSSSKIIRNLAIVLKTFRDTLVIYPAVECGLVIANKFSTILIRLEMLSGHKAKRWSYIDSILSKNIQIQIIICSFRANQHWAHSFHLFLSILIFYLSLC